MPLKALFWNVAVKFEMPNNPGETAVVPSIFTKTLSFIFS